MNKTKRHFPLLWGILALGLFGAFAVVTQLQFNRISDHKIFEAQEYQRRLNDQIDEKITVPLADNLPPKRVEECPAIPETKPVRPEE